jgi:hypothetical protein
MSKVNSRIEVAVTDSGVLKTRGSNPGAPRRYQIHLTKPVAATELLVTVASLAARITIAPIKP